MFVSLSIRSSLAHRYLEYHKDTDTNEDMSVTEVHEDHRFGQNQTRLSDSKQAAAIDNQLVSASTRKGKKNSLITGSFQVSASTPRVQQLHEDRRFTESPTRRAGSKRVAAINNKLVSIKKSTTSTRKGKKNSLITESIQMSTSMPHLANSSMFSHRYETRHQRRNSSIFSHH